MTRKYYTLSGLDGNAYTLMGYTSRALKETGHSDLVDTMQQEAKSGDYDHLIRVCLGYLDIANQSSKEENGE